MTSGCFVLWKELYIKLSLRLYMFILKFNHVFESFVPFKSFSSEKAFVPMCLTGVVAIVSHRVAMILRVSFNKFYFVIIGKRM